MKSSLWTSLAGRARAATPPRPAALAVTLGGLAALHALGPAATAALRYERAALAAGEAWRALTAHLVHHDVAHLALNAAGLALLWYLYARDATPRAWLVVALACGSTTTAGLWFLRPDVEWYLGASGVLHGLWAAAGVAAWRRWPLEAGVALGLLAAKLAFEQWRGPLTAAADAALPVLVDAHLYGAAGGLAAALALRLQRRPL